MTSPLTPVPLSKKVLFWVELSLYWFVSVVSFVPLVLIPIFWIFFLAPENRVKKRVYFRPFDYWAFTRAKRVPAKKGYLASREEAVCPTATGNNFSDRTFRSFVSLNDLVLGGYINPTVLGDFLWGLRYVGFGKPLSAIYSCGNGKSYAGSAPVYEFYKVPSPLCCLTFIGGKKEFDYSPFYLETEESKKLMIHLMQGGQYRVKIQSDLEALRQGQVGTGESLGKLREVVTVIGEVTMRGEMEQKEILENIKENISSAEKKISDNISELSTRQVLANDSCSAVKSIVASTQSEIKQGLQSVHKTVIAKSEEAKELLAHLIDGRTGYTARLTIERTHLTKQLAVITGNIAQIQSSPRSNSKNKKEATLFSEELRCVLFSVEGRSSDEIVEMLAQNAQGGIVYRKNTDSSKITRMRKSAVLSLAELGILSVEKLLLKSIKLSDDDITQKRTEFLRQYSTDLTNGVDKKDYSDTLGGDLR